MKLTVRLAWVVILGFLAACSSTPRMADHSEASDYARETSADHETASQAAEIAQKMVGKPYRYGGNTPNGFDCSGLVHYSYTTVGVAVPRTTRSQLRAGLPVTTKTMRVGDLVFFDQEGKKMSHVGIYIGNGRFVHAPSSGKRVRIDSLNKDYWQEHFVAARRF